MVQKYPIKDWDTGIKKFYTTCGKIVRLELMAEDECFLLFFRSRGKFMIKVGYTYGLYKDDSNEPLITGKYRIQEKILTNGSAMCICTGGNTDVFVEESDIFTEEICDEYGGDNIGVSDLDIISISLID